MSPTKLIAELLEWKDPESAIKVILELEGKKKKEVSRLLLMENHAELMTILNQFLEKCMKIAERKNAQIPKQTQESPVISGEIDSAKNVSSVPVAPSRVYIHRQGDPRGMSLDASTLLPKKIQEVISQLDWYFSRNKISVTIEREDFFLNAFGTLYVSGLLDKEKIQEIVKGLNHLSIPYKISWENTI